MKEIKTTRTIEEVTGYEAFDGTRFSSEVECRKYEDSAEGVIKARAEQYLIGETSIYGLLDEGSDECGVDIYNIPDKEAATIIAQYINIVTGDTNTCVDKYIGKELVIFWNYDRDYAWFNTLDGIIKNIKNNYKTAIAYTTERKENKNV